MVLEWELLSAAGRARGKQGLLLSLLWKVGAMGDFMVGRTMVRAIFLLSLSRSHSQAPRPLPMANLCLGHASPEVTQLPVFLPLLGDHHIDPQYTATW